MSHYLVWLLKRLRPREGWALLLLTLLTLLCLPAALLDERSDTGTAGLIFLTALAVIIGLRMAHSRISARRAALVGSLIGIGLTLVFVGRLLPPLSLLWSEAGHTLGWINDWRQGVLGWPLPFTSLAAFIWQKLDALGWRLWWWVQTISSGSQTQDRIVLLLLTAFFVWSSALFAAWQIYRRRSVLVGLLPTGAATAIIAFFKGGTAIVFLVTYLFCTLWLVASCHLRTRRERWEKSGTDYPGGLGLELTFALAPMLTLVLLIAGFMPNLYANSVREAFWRVMDAPWSRIERAAERYVGPIDTGVPTGIGLDTGAGGTLPRSHLLGGRPNLSEIIVLYVSTNDPPPPPPSPDQPEEQPSAYPRRYWRSETYDTYTGLGWTNSPLDSRTLPSNQYLDPAPPPGTDLFQQFRRIAPQQTLVFAANNPYRVDIPVHAWTRPPDDLAYLTGEADLYTILSRVPEPTVADLRASSPISATLPPEIAQRYLALPDIIPQRVLDLAQEVAGGAPTRYDQARAIELYLREYPYNLDLPKPPNDRDLVDYFLFDLQEGYCDYYASAMVVMLRAVGVPARLASGYAQGTFDQKARRWVVTEQDGHSWVEVYFDGTGWVEFEPTTGRPALVRPGGENLATPTLPPLPPRPARWWQRMPWGLVAIGVILLLLVAAVVWLWRPRRAIAAAELVRDRQGRLQAWGARLGHPLRDGQTAREYGEALGEKLHTRGQDSRLPRTRRASAAAPAQIEHLSEAFVRAQYGREPVSDREGWQIRDLWTRLRRHLQWLWLAPPATRDRDESRRIHENTEHRE